MNLKRIFINGITIKISFNPIKILHNKWRAKYSVGQDLMTMEGNPCKVIGVACGYYPDVSYDIYLLHQNIIDERREKSLKK